VHSFYGSHRISNREFYQYCVQKRWWLDRTASYYVRTFFLRFYFNCFFSHVKEAPAASVPQMWMIIYGYPLCGLLMVIIYRTKMWIFSKTPVIKERLEIRTGWFLKFKCFNYSWKFTKKYLKTVKEMRCNLQKTTGFEQILAERES